MKAKEYAERVLKCSTNQEMAKAIADCAREFLLEFDKIRKIRNIQTDKSLIPLVREFDQKFKRFAQIVNATTPSVNPEGFLKLLQHVAPDTVKFYEASNC